MSGLAAANTEDITVEIDEGADTPDIDERGNVLRIRSGDGSLVVSLDGKPLSEARDETDTGWYSNLVDKIDDAERSRIADELLRGIGDDIESRRDWIDDRALGIKLLGLKVEVPGLSGAADSAPVDGMSRIRHPLLLEAVLRFQANARSEMLPSDGPCKVRNDDPGSPVQEDLLANTFEMDMNHYLTVTASEYYPDTDRMLLMLGFGGTSFKKVYNCPLRNRPVSETIDADDLIVSNTATDLKNARRITHRANLRPSVVKRLQILGVYRDLDLGTPIAATLDSAQEEKKAQQGVSPDVANPYDRDREIYECYCELDISGFEHKHKGRASGLEIPYVVTIDVSSREILAIVRNYRKDTQRLPQARTRFVKYTFVPGFGFYDIGLLHILGNSTNALTAAWRELLDSGMFANFPGFLYSDVGGRQNTNIFRVPPGGGAPIKTGGQPIGQAVMPLPYNAQAMAPLMALSETISETGQRIGGTSEAQVGEGRSDAPVGTTLANIEQSTKVLNSVHKRMHASQCEELRLIVECFRENPESFVNAACRSQKKWDIETFMEALDNCDLTPRADPNTASQSQRLMKIMALKTLQAANPSMYDPIAIDTAAIQAIGYDNPQQFFAPPEAQAAPPPELVEAQAKTANDTKKADASMLTAQAHMAEVQAKAQQGGFAPKPGLGGDANPEVDQMTARARLMDAETKRAQLGLQHQDTMIEDQNRDRDRDSRERIAVMSLAKEIMTDPGIAGSAAHQAEEIDGDIKPGGGKDE